MKNMKRNVLAERHSLGRDVQSSGNRGRLGVCHRRQATIVDRRVLEQLVAVPDAQPEHDLHEEQGDGVERMAQLRLLGIDARALCNPNTRSAFDRFRTAVSQEVSGSPGSTAQAFCALASSPSFIEPLRLMKMRSVTSGTKARKQKPPVMR